MSLSLNQIEKMCNKASMKAVEKTTYGDYTLYIADGFSKQPHVTFQRFDVQPGEFIFGAYGTIAWVAKDDDVITGFPAIFDRFHDVDEGWSNEIRQRARVNFVRTQAQDALTLIAKEEKNDTLGSA